VKILNIVPIVSTEGNAKELEHIRENGAPGFEYEITGVEYGGVTSIEGLYFIAVTAPYVVERMIQAEKQGYDAVTCLCFGDPGIKEAREMVRIPVIGSAQAALHTALLCGERIGIVTIGRTYRTSRHSVLINELHRLVRHYGLSDRVVSIRTTGAPTENCHDDDIFETLRRESLAALSDGADVIVLGCNSLFAAARRLQEELDVPVIEPTLATIRVAEHLLLQKLTHSKLATPDPRECGAGCTMRWPSTLR
jgi:allantoin racemase